MQKFILFYCPSHFRLVPRHFGSSGDGTGDAFEILAPLRSTALLRAAFNKKNKEIRKAKTKGYNNKHALIAL